MAEAKNIFIGFLKKRNLKLTRQRENILDIFLKTERHLSVDDFYAIVKNRNLGIGHTTVFRTLKLLSKAGIAKEIDFGDKRIRYEHKYGHEHHDHLLCVKCGRFIETMDPAIERLQDRLCKKFGFSPQQHIMEIFGICKRCDKGGGSK